jgi:hypothetical protein
MQDIQNIPPPDANPLDIEDDFDSHSDYSDIDAERDNSKTDVESIPVPPDRQDESTPIEEPPTTTNEEGIDEDGGEPPRLL